MDIKFKKIALLIGFLAITALLAYAIYFVFFRGSAEPISPPVDTGQEPVIGGLPTAGPGTSQPPQPVTSPDGLPIANDQTDISEVARGGITYTAPLSINSVKGVKWTASGNLTYYDQQEQRFYQFDSNGKPQLLTDKQFYNLENIIWSPNQLKAILEYPDGSNIVYDFQTNKQVTLPSHWEEFAWSPNGQQIVNKSIGLDPNNRWLMTANTDGSNARKIEPLGDNADIVTVDWSPNNQVIATYVKGEDFDRQNLFFVGLHGENFKSATIEGRGFRGQWDPDGSRLLYSVYSSASDYQPTLWITDAQGNSIGQNRHDLKINTWADKCVFASDTALYCGVPKSLEEMSGIFPQLAADTKDDLYYVDLKTGSQTLIAQPTGDYNISQPTISPDGRLFNFIDSQTGKLYQIRLK